MPYHLLWSGVGAQLLFYRICHQNQISLSKRMFRDFIICRGLGLVVCYCLIICCVRRWWPAIVLSHVPPKPNFTVQNERFARFYHLPWSGVGGLLLSYHLLWPGVGHLPPKTNFIVKTQKQHTERKHRENTHRQHRERKHTDRKNTNRKRREKTHREKTQRENTEKTHRQKTHKQKTQTENTQRENTDRKHTDRKHTNRKRREKTHREKTQRKHTDKKTFTEQASQTNVSREASSKFHRTKLPKHRFSVSCEASPKFQRTSFQNERFVGGFLEISKNKLPKRAFRTMLRQFSQKKLPKRSFRAMLPRNLQNKLPKRSFRTRPPPIFREQASKTSVSCEASSKIHRTMLPKRTFRAKLPRNFTEQASKTNVSCEASFKFPRTKLPKRTFRAMHPTISKEICVSPQFRAIDPPNPTRGFIQQKQNVRLATTACHSTFQNPRFTTAAYAKMYESSAGSPGQHAAYKNHHFTTVSDI